MNDAQFGLAQLLRPPTNFVTDYQGTVRPIPFPGILDEQAGRAGYDPNLLGGLPVPIGSRLCIWLPWIWNNDNTLDDENDFGFVYKIAFRLRNPRDYRNPGQGNMRKPYHLKNQSPGAPDSSGGPAQPRFVLPACMWIVGYQQPESRLIVNPQNGHNASNPAVRTYAEGFMPNSLGMSFAPFAPGTTNAGVIQQGIVNPAVPFAGSPTFPMFHPVFIDACGDDMIILLQKVQPVAAQPTNSWDFAGMDSRLSTFFTSSENSGIFVLSGTMP
jgi:hypothetical protein